MTKHLDSNELMNLFVPREAAGKKYLTEGDGHVVYYTSAETALNLINNKEFWFRDYRCMNDHMEVRHGLKLVNDYFSPDNGKCELLSLFDGLHDGAGQEAYKLFLKFKENDAGRIYMICFSKHPIDENRYGRLSMWRAYGAQSGVAIVLNGKTVHENGAMPFLLPCTYTANLGGECDAILSGAKKVLPRIQETSRNDVVFALYAMMLAMAVSSKHPGFVEEQEIRLLDMPGLFDGGVLKDRMVSIGGVPQLVRTYSLADMKTKTDKPQTMDELIQHVIIGPTEFPDPIADALISALKKAGLKKPEERVTLSNIPLRR